MLGGVGMCEPRPSAPTNWLLSSGARVCAGLHRNIRSTGSTGGRTLLIDDLTFSG